MNGFTYNNLEFQVDAAGSAWDIRRKLPGGGMIIVGAAMFPGVPAAEAHTRALALVRSIFPRGVTVVGPDVAYPDLIGDIGIVGADVAHPWDKNRMSYRGEMERELPAELGCD